MRLLEDQETLRKLSKDFADASERAAGARRKLLKPLKLLRRPSGRAEGAHDD
jgi:hypothetical protein